MRPLLRRICRDDGQAFRDLGNVQWAKKKTNSAHTGIYMARLGSGPMHIGRAGNLAAPQEATRERQKYECAGGIRNG